MPNNTEIIGTMQDLKKTTSAMLHEGRCFDILKSKVKPSQKLMVAISGGPDSMLTACLLVKFRLHQKYNVQNLFFIHCNHGTRTGNQQDERCIQSFFTTDNLIIVKRNSTKKATESQLRTRRYQQFAKQCQRHHIDQLVLGHNLNDRIESSFLNLLRGSHLNGLLAIQQQESHHLLGNTQILRPLLGMSKPEVLAICKKYFLPYRIDPSNKDTTTSLRNQLRNKVLPELLRLAHKTTPSNTFLQSFQNIYEELETHQQSTINLTPITTSPYRKANYAYQRMIDRHDIDETNISQLIKQLNIYNNISRPLLKERTTFLRNNTSGYKRFNGTYVFISHGNIYLISAPKNFRQQHITATPRIPAQEKNMRFPKAGDRYKGKTRNQYCINQKIPLFRRNFIPILADNNTIVKYWKTW